MKNKMIISIILCLLVSLFALGCDVISNEGYSPNENFRDCEISSSLAEDEPNKNLDDEVFASPATLMEFSSLENFTSFAASAKDGGDTAKLSSLEYYYLPTGIPTDYQLYKITAGSMDIAFWYLPEEALVSDDAKLNAELRQEHFMFISSRGTYVFESEMSSLGATSDDLIEGKYLIPNYAPNMIIWEEDDVVLMMYLPKDYAVEDWDTMFSTEKFVRNDQRSFQKASE